MFLCRIHLNMNKYSHHTFTSLHVWSGSDPFILLFRMNGTGPGAGRTMWPLRGHGTPGGWRRTRSPSGPASWRRRTPPCALRWRTWGRSSAAARTFWPNTRHDTGPCEVLPCSTPSLPLQPLPPSLQPKGQDVFFLTPPTDPSPITPVWFSFSCHTAMSFFSFLYTPFKYKYTKYTATSPFNVLWWASWDPASSLTPR